jgi:HK97 family phage prohead protease
VSDHDRKPRHRSIPLPVETRTTLAFDPDSVQIKKNSATGILRGTAIVYHRADRPAEYPIHDGYADDPFIERMMPGCADGVVSEDVHLILGHNTASIPMARTRSGTMTLESTDHGLQFRAEIDRSSQQGNDVLSAVSRGDLGGVSVGMIVRDDTWSLGENRQDIREISRVDVREISIVAWPASPQTDVQVAERSAARFRRALTRAQRGQLTQEDFDALLGDKGKAKKEKFADVADRMRERQVRLTIGRQAALRNRVRDLLSEEERKNARSRQVRDKMRKRGF